MIRGHRSRNIWIVFFVLEKDTADSRRYSVAIGLGVVGLILCLIFTWKFSKRQKEKRPEVD